MTEVIDTNAVLIKNKGRPRTQTYEQYIDKQRKASLAYYYAHKKTKMQPCQFVSQKGNKCRVNTSKIYCHKHADHRNINAAPPADN